MVSPLEPWLGGLMLRHRSHPVRTLTAAALSLGLCAVVSLYLPPERTSAPVALATEAVATIPPTTTTTAPRPVERPSRSAGTPRRITTAVPGPTGGTATLAQLDALAMCESGMNPRANTGNGFYGAFQWMLSTWRGLGMAGNPIDYSYEQQRLVAQRIPTPAWGRQFPACSRRLRARGVI